MQGLEEVRLAREAGADIVVAQGTEAAGHGGGRATLPLAGGGGCSRADAGGGCPRIADGRGLAAAVMQGAHGALIGTRFYASPEALGHDSAKQRIAVARGNETAHNRLFDTVRGYGWPARTPGVRFAMVSWTAGPAARAFLAVALEAEHALNRAAARVGDCDTALVWAGEAVDLIHNVENAAALVAGISAEA